jgi:hypothetical protein
MGNGNAALIEMFNKCLAKVGAVSFAMPAMTAAQLRLYQGVDQCDLKNFD